MAERAGAVMVLLMACSASLEAQPAWQGSKQRRDIDGFTRSDSKRSSTVPPKKSRGTYGRTDFTWTGGVVTSVVINISEQRIYFYEGSDVIGTGPISTGKAGYSTPTGRFSVLSKHAKYRSNSYGVAISNGRVVDADVTPGSCPPGSYFKGSSMPFFMRITGGGVGMHAGFVTGAPASHGCIRLPYGLAQRAFAATSVGTPVTVTNGGAVEEVAETPARRRNDTPQASSHLIGMPEIPDLR